MIDQEKIIKALDCCLDIVRSGRWASGCITCPYAVEENSCREKMILDAIALLKEQEPRVMKLEEVKAFGWDYCYLEEERLPGKEYRSVCGDYALTCITWPCIASMRIQHGDDSYGTKWRCWSAKPTDEQRQEVKWE